MNLNKFEDPSFVLHISELYIEEPVNTSIKKQILLLI